MHCLVGVVFFYKRGIKSHFRLIDKSIDYIAYIKEANLYLKESFLREYRTRSPKTERLSHDLAENYMGVGKVWLKFVPISINNKSCMPPQHICYYLMQ